MSLVEKMIEKSKAAARQPGPLARSVGGTQGSDVLAAGAATVLNRPAKPRRTMRIVRRDLCAAGVLPPDSEATRVANEFRAIKRALLGRLAAGPSAAAQRSSAVMVASALPGEGKTFTSVNLAMSLASEKDLHVVLVDADVAKPHTSQAFGLGGEVGLLEALVREELGLDDIIIDTDLPRFSVLPAGRPVPTATELLSSGRMASLLREGLASPLPTVFVFDSSPILVTTEGRALADAIGNVVMVVKAGSTPRSAVTEALQLIGESKHVSLILNRDAAKPETGYYYAGGDQSAGTQV